MFIPANTLWGVAGFLAIAVIRLGYKALKDIDHAYIKIRRLEAILKVKDEADT